MPIVKEREKEKVENYVLERAETFNPDDFDFDDPDEQPPDLDRFYGPLRNYIKMVIEGHSNLLMLDAKGGLGKTHNVCDELSDHLSADQWTHLRGFTTPVELFTTLWKARRRDHILFLDDMSGVTSNRKAVDMLKSATDTSGKENWVEYRTSRGIENPDDPDMTLPQTFHFGGRIIMSFNKTPDNAHFNALKDRGTFYNLAFTYDERLDLIREIAKFADFSPLSVTEQQETAEWVASVTDPSIEVSIRTFEHACKMRHFGQKEDEDWERMALEVFDLNYDKYLILRMREESDLTIEEQRAYFEEATGRSESVYYDLLSEIKDDRM